MSKVLHVLRLALLEPHFVDHMNSIWSLAIFYSVYYAKARLTCIFSALAPSNHLVFVKNLEEICIVKGILPYDIQTMVKLALNKIKDLTCYLNEQKRNLFRC